PALAGVPRAVNLEGGVGAEERMEDGARLARVEGIVVAGENLLDRRRIAEEHERRAHGHAQAEGLTVATRALVEERDRPVGVANGLDPPVAARAGRKGRAHRRSPSWSYDLVIRPNEGQKNSFRHLEDEARYALQLRAQALAGGLRGVHAAAEHVLLAVYVGEGAHESGGDDEDRRRRVDRGLRHQTLEHARAETGQIGEHPADAEEAHLIPLERHAEGEAHRIGLGNQEIQERVDEIVDQLPSRVAGLQVPHDGVARAIAETREYRFPELLLAPPMIVERPERHVRPARDVPHRG